MVNNRSSPNAKHKTRKLWHSEGASATTACSRDPPGTWPCILPLHAKCHATNLLEAPLQAVPPRCPLTPSCS
jgi:hypothetical protein